MLPLAVSIRSGWFMSMKHASLQVAWVVFVRSSMHHVSPVDVDKTCGYFLIMRSRSVMVPVDVDRTCGLSGSRGRGRWCKAQHLSVPRVQDSKIAKWQQPSGWCREGKQCWWGRCRRQAVKKNAVGVVISTNRTAAQAVSMACTNQVDVEAVEHHANWKVISQHERS